MVNKGDDFLFKILKHMVGSDGFISDETIDLAESGNSLLGAFNFYSGGVKRIPLQLAYGSYDTSEGSLGGPTVSDFLFSIYAYFGDDNFSQKYTLERFDEVTNQVFFRNTMTDKTLKVRVLLDPENYDYGFFDNDDNPIDLNFESFKPLIPDESGCFYLADEHDFSQAPFCFILEFNCEAKFVSSFESAAEFQIGLDFKALEVSEDDSEEDVDIIQVCQQNEFSYYEGTGGMCSRVDCPAGPVECQYRMSI